jgi:serine/threonine protein kinase
MEQHQGSLVVAGYWLTRRLGRGSFGEVWRAVAPGGVAVAVRIIHRPPHAAVKEAQALAGLKRLRNPHLLPFADHRQLEDRLVLLSLLADDNLRDLDRKRHRNGGPGIPTPELLGYFREAALGLDYLHSQQVLHRNVKSANILLIDGHAKVADFALGRVAEQGQWPGIHGTATPTWHYLAPEVVHNRISPGSDQYGLAASYAELRLDHPLFPGRNHFEVLAQILEATPNLAPLPDAEKQVLRRALARDPHQRYPSCRAFVRALEAAQQGPAAGSSSPEAASNPRYRSEARSASV